MSRKDDIEGFFRSRGPNPWGGYDNPSIQGRLRMSLDFIGDYVAQGFSGQFIEIGAFNGCFSRMLKQRYPACTMYVNDIAGIAIAQAKETLRGFDGVHFIEADLMEIEPAPNHDWLKQSVLLLLECLYYMDLNDRAEGLRRLIDVFRRPPIFISGPITGHPRYFEEDWLIAQFLTNGYGLIDCAPVTLRGGAAGRIGMRGRNPLRGYFRRKRANQVIYLFRPTA
jgi:hypothetical protein